MYSLFLESWAALPTHEKTTMWTGDLRDIEAFAVSKSDLGAHLTLDAFAERQTMIVDRSCTES
jgi:hypothetical protein